MARGGSLANPAGRASFAVSTFVRRSRGQSRRRSPASRRGSPQGDRGSGPSDQGCCFIHARTRSPAAEGVRLGLAHPYGKSRPIQEDRGRLLLTHKHYQRKGGEGMPVGESRSFQHLWQCAASGNLPYVICAHAARFRSDRKRDAHAPSAPCSASPSAITSSNNAVRKECTKGSHMRRRFPGGDAIFMYIGGTGCALAGGHLPPLARTSWLLWKGLGTRNHERNRTRKCSYRVWKGRVMTAKSRMLDGACQAPHPAFVVGRRR